MGSLCSLPRGLGGAPGIPAGKPRQPLFRRPGRRRPDLPGAGAPHRRRRPARRRQRLLAAADVPLFPRRLPAGLRRRRLRSGAGGPRPDRRLLLPASLPPFPARPAVGLGRRCGGRGHGPLGSARLLRRGAAVGGARSVPLPAPAAAPGAGTGGNRPRRLGGGRLRRGTGCGNQAEHHPVSRCWPPARSRGCGRDRPREGISASCWPRWSGSPASPGPSPGATPRSAASSCSSRRTAG